ncbi:hypothetical protein PV327_009831 [Microctonus hyperodae]|uniref:Proteasome assembly chaperone 1 n=1 Tax=Microctonus hyperodae TaxID=165561 RepID=A0AA39F1S9_MICHY|nr:hypothetical protein PV327_009831 [Microctonus hyperodae]
MATLFGEVVYPSSRAFWTEDEDDETSENIESLPTFTVDYSCDAPTKIKNLIVTETHLIVDFTKEYITKNATQICTIKSTISTNKNPTKLYKVTNDLYVLIVCPDIDLTQASDFVESISGLLQKCENITAITCNHISQLKTIDDTHGPAFMRTLCTRKFSNQQKIPISTLKQPNIVSGVAAGVVAYAEIMDLSATLNVLYLDGFQLDSESAAPLMKLFTNLTNYKFDNFTSMGKHFFNKGNLYMYTKIFII